jgi:DNA invertase Pin-like site-specific DNA recombinase
MEDGKNKAVIYCRVSTREQVDEGNSLITQEKACREYASKHNYEVSQVFIEQGESAKTANRTELQRLLSFCSNKKNQISVVIAYKIDRISRNTDDYSSIRILLKRQGVEIKSTSEHFENTPAGKFMENIIANVAQFDNDVRTERTINGMKEAVREGRYVWKPPLGYSNIRVLGKSTIRANEIAPIIQQAFLSLASGNENIEEVRQKVLNAALINIGKPAVSRTNFHQMIRNELYAGVIKKFGEVHRGIFEPILSLEVFEQVQRILKARRKNYKHYLIDNPDFPLRRFVQYSGMLLTGSWCQGRSRKYAFYRFHKHGMSFKKDWLENKFCDYLNQYKMPENYFKWFKESVLREVDKQLKSHMQELSKLQIQIEELKNYQSALIQKNIKGIINDNVAKLEIERVELEITDLVGKSMLVDQNVEPFEVITERVKDFLLNPVESWKISPPQLKVKLQWFYFPQGIIFDGRICQTNEICNLFKLKNDSFDKEFSRAPSAYKKTNHSHVANNAERAILHNESNSILDHQKVSTSDMFLSDIKHELVCLDKIILSNNDADSRLK